MKGHGGQKFEVPVGNAEEGGPPVGFSAKYVIAEGSSTCNGGNIHADEDETTRERAAVAELSKEGFYVIDAVICESEDG